MTNNKNKKNKPCDHLVARRKKSHGIYECRCGATIAVLDVL